MARQRSRRGSQFALDKERLKKFIEDNNPDELVKCAQELGEHLASTGLTSAQIRNIFGVARRLKSTWPSPADEEPKNLLKSRNSLVMLKPKLAYQTARKSEVGPLQEWLSAAIDLVYEVRQNREDEFVRFTRFFDFFEATLAYHKYHGGKDK